MTLNNNQSVPFEISEVSHGLQKAQGLLRLKKEGLEFEFEVEDSFIGYFKSGVTTLLIPFGDLEEITFKKGWFSSKVILEGTSMKAFENLPGTDVATCTLKIERKDKKEAEALISKARMLLSEYRLNQMDGED
ncbi:MAG TPA: hypothetical protein VJ964_13665 [Balneolaceae bacterium]|nr:hypothetical protein [Balneolaceae bacterium]